MAETAATLRHFNRSFTRRIGLLDESFLDSGRTLGSSRLLFDIGPAGADVLALRSKLGLDSGYLSRLLSQLESEGLVAVSTHPDDSRRRLVDLTEAGLAEWRRLDSRSQELAERLLGPLSDEQLSELQTSLTTAERLLRAATVIFDGVDPLHDQSQWAMREYFRELDVRFPTGFDPGDALTNGAAALSPPAGVFLVARSDGQVAGCGGLQRFDDGTAELKRMWIHPDWRGLGLGRRLLGRLESEARIRGYSSVRLDTNSVLVVARTMYESAGYEAIDRYNDNPYARHWYEKRL